MVSKFDKFKQFINYNVGKVVSRQKLLAYCNETEYDSNVTVDNYRRQAEVLGYITSVYRGVYKVNKPIDERMSCKTLRTNYERTLEQR